MVKCLLCFSSPFLLICFHFKRKQISFTQYLLHVIGPLKFAQHLVPFGKIKLFVMSEEEGEEGDEGEEAEGEGGEEEDGEE